MKKIVLLIGFCSFTFAQDIVAVPQTSKSDLTTAKELMRRMRDRYDKCETFSADFVKQSETSKILGRVAYKKPRRFFIKYGVGSSSEVNIYSSGGGVLIYIPAMRVVLQQDGTDKSQNFEASEVKQAVVNVDVLMNKYNYEFFDGEKLDGGLYHLSLKPTNPEDFLDNMEIWVDSSGYLRKTLTYTGAGDGDDKLVIEYFNIKINQAMADSDFDFEESPGIEKIMNPIIFDP